MEESKARYYGWSVVFASWLAVFCLFGYRATFAILKGPIGITLGWTAAQVTLGYSLMMVCYAVTAYFSGWILDKWGTKPVYAIAAVFGGLGYILTARIDTNLGYLFTFGLLGGIATGMLWVTSTVSVRKWYTGRAYATMIVMGVGPFLGSYIGGWLKDVSGKYTFSIYFALFSFVASIFLSTSLPLKAEPKQRSLNLGSLDPSRRGPSSEN